jgi:hypothetical protein
VGSGQWAVGSGQWAVGSGQWAVGSGQWAVGSGHSRGPLPRLPPRVCRCALPPQLTVASTLGRCRSCVVLWGVQGLTETIAARVFSGVLMRRKPYEDASMYSAGATTLTGMPPPTPAEQEAMDAIVLHFLMSSKLE